MRGLSSSDKWSRRSEEHTSELQSPCNLVCRLLLEKKKKKSELQSPCNLGSQLLLQEEASTLTRCFLFCFHNVSTHDYLTCFLYFSLFFFFNDTATTEIYTLSLHDALPIYSHRPRADRQCQTATARSRRH